ncbi:MAG: hypothetical protein KGJ68_04300 [Gammaproteobacteria bacterium]|nr:hypothetical protein [Gammaproteobacteria bacterium]
MSRRITAVAFSSVCMMMAGAVCAAAAPLTAASLQGADFDFVLANLASNSAFVEYGAVQLAGGGKANLEAWTDTEREPIPRQVNVGPLSPTVEIQADRFHDRGAKVLSHPASFRDGARHAVGSWWVQGDGLCVRFDGDYALYFTALPETQGNGKWGRILTNKANPAGCGTNAAAGATAAAPDEVVGALSERVYSRSQTTIRVKYEPFDGSISRLNGWDNKCPVFKWQSTLLNFKSDIFGPAGKDIWRNVIMEKQKNAPDMPVFSYLSLSQQPVPEIGRIVIMDVGHDFNRNGRIDDDWGHIYAGFPILSATGDFGGALLFDFSPVGIQEIPYKGGCTAGGTQLTHTLGLILYVANELHTGL